MVISLDMKKKKVLVLCTGNSCRSQMAEGYLRFFSKNLVEIYSAGIETHGVNPNAIIIMEEDGIDISRHTSNHIDEYSDIRFDYIITVCDNAKESCPIFIGNGIRLHYDFPDPAKVIGTEDEVLHAFREVRNSIKNYSKDFISKHMLN